MAKTTKTPATFPIAFPQGNALPADQGDYLKSIYNNAAADYALQPYADVHPYKAALAGFFNGGIPAAIDARSTSQAYRRLQQDKDVKDFTDAYSNALKNQQTIDTSNDPVNFGTGLQTQLDSLRADGRIPNSTPDLYQRTLPPLDDAAYQAQNGHPWQQNKAPYMSRDNYLQLFKQAAGQSDIQALADNLPGFTQSGMNVTNRASGKPGVLQGSIGSYEPSLPSVIVNPDALQSQLASGYQTGLGQGTERYKIDQEAPKRAAEIQKLMLEGKTEEAKALLTGAQVQTEKQKPGLVRSEIGKNNATANYENTRYRGGPAASQPTVAALMQKNYLAGVYGQPGTPEAISAFQSALANDPSGYSTETTNTYDPSGKKVISSSSRRVPIRGGSSSGSSGKGSGVQTKLSTGRKVNL